MISWEFLNIGYNHCDNKSDPSCPCGKGAPKKPINKVGNVNTNKENNILLSDSLGNT